jgi:hypothetical protein
LQHPLRVHILSLESRLQGLHDQLTSPGLSPAARDSIATQIEFATDALAHYREAFALEHVLATNDSNQPPSRQTPKL